ncbi:MAG: PKD domain-containing protein [Bacteroidetes bacterium]|nr:PKD domain-containing protein [Bacteroidota bacterium]
MKALILIIVLGMHFSDLIAAKSTLSLRLQSVNTGYLDDASIYFEENAISSFNSTDDELLVSSPFEGVPELFSFTSDGIKCSKNGFGNLSSTEIVPLGFEVDIDGNYNISAINLTNFDPSCLIRLEDRQTNVFTDLRTGTYTALLNTSDSDSGRFYIHVTHPAVFTYVNSGCQNNEGSITVTIDPTVPWDICQLYDTANNLIETIANVNPVASFNGLAQGKYYVAFLTGFYSSGKYFELGGNYITSSMQTPNDPIYVGQRTTFHALASNTTQYEWDFGDGTLITGVANPPMTYYTPGTYPVNVMCSNTYGCSASSQMMITVEVPSGIREEKKQELMISVQGNILRLNRKTQVADHAQVQIFDLLGRPIYKAPWQTMQCAIDLNDQPAGYYILSVAGEKDVSTSRIFIER